MGNGQKCEYTTADGLAFDLSKCGFNTDQAGWCNKRKGDQWFKTALSDFKQLDFTSVNCHVLSGIESCMEFKKLNQTIIHEFKRAVIETDYDIGYANYALNDKCVANAITVSYWQDDYPDFAFGVPMPILTLFALFSVL